MYAVILTGGKQYRVSEGDVIGCVFTGEQFDGTRSKTLSDETELKLIQTAGIFLGKQMES